MGVIEDSFLGGYIPICNDCGIQLCWGISIEEYVVNIDFWEEWLCKECISYRRNNNIEINYQVREKYEKHIQKPHLHLS